MTESRLLQPHAAAPSANDLFKLGYPRVLRRSALVAVLLTAAFAWFFPRYEPLPYQLRRTETVIIDLPDPVAAPEPPRPREVPPPPRPIEAVGDPAAAEDPADWSSLLLPVDPPTAAPVDLGSLDFVASSSKPVLIHRARADYPEIARRAGLEGTVVVNVLVGVDGRVDQAVVVRGVHPVLDRAAMRAASLCRFEPGRQRDFTVKAWLAVPYRFRLR